MIDPSHCPACGAQTKNIHMDDGLHVTCSECAWNDTINLEDDYADYDPDGPVMCYNCGVQMVLTGRDDYGGDIDEVCDHYYCEKCEATTEQNCLSAEDYDDYEDEYDDWDAY